MDAAGIAHLLAFLEETDRQPVCRIGAGIPGRLRGHCGSYCAKYQNPCPIMADRGICYSSRKLEEVPRVRIPMFWQN